MHSRHGPVLQTAETSATFKSAIYFTESTVLYLFYGLFKHIVFDNQHVCILSLTVLNYKHKNHQKTNLWMFWKF